MNILFITHEKNLNGASKSMLNLIDEMSDRHIFYVVSPFKEGPVYEELKKRKLTVLHSNIKRWCRKKNNSNLKWLAISLKWKLYNRFFNMCEAEQLKKQIENLNIDLIHTNTSVINMGGLLRKKTGIPHVWYVREFGKEDFDLHPLDSKRQFYRFIDRNSDALVFVSEALAQKYRPHIMHVNTYIIYNGIGKENIILNRRYEKKSCYNFLISGTIQPGKAQDVAIKAAGELIKEGINNFKLSIAGSGDMEPLKNLIPEQENYVEFLGRISDMPSLRAGIDVELVCSKSEAFGRVTAEAMMGGIPVIGADTGGTPELICDGETGLLCKQGDYKVLAEKMKYFIEHPEEIERIGRNAQTYAKAHFTIKRCADEVNLIYSSLEK